MSSAVDASLEKTNCRLHSSVSIEAQACFARGKEDRDQRRYPSMALTFRSRSDIGMLTERRYEEYIEHVMSLTPKQRKKWHIMIRDERGIGRRMYFDGCFKIKTEHGVVLVGGPSSVQMIEESLEQRLPGLHPEHPGQGLPFLDRIVENRTGNHYRNRTVRVPTAPGEPVRG